MAMLYTGIKVERKAIVSRLRYRTIAAQTGSQRKYSQVIRHQTCIKYVVCYKETVTHLVIADAVFSLSLPNRPKMRTEACI